MCQKKPQVTEPRDFAQFPCPRSCTFHLYTIYPYPHYLTQDYILRETQRDQRLPSRVHLFFVDLMLCSHTSCLRNSIVYRHGGSFIVHSCVAGPVRTRGLQIRYSSCICLSPVKDTKCTPYRPLLSSMDTVDSLQDEEQSNYTRSTPKIRTDRPIGAE